jgi:hypothetical protein
VIDQKEDFSAENYRQLIRFISMNYSSIFFDEYISDNQNKLVLLRHDIDISLTDSLNLAKIEYDFGMKSTFFVNMHSDFYNFFEKESISYLKEILKLGHSIGIHFDATFWDLQDEEQLVKNLVFEKLVIDKALEIKTNVFSFHNPNEFTLSFKKDKYAGILNAYSDRFMNDFKYCSDSNGYWRHERMFDVVESLDYDRLQLLTHPGWWTNEIKNPREKIYATIYKRAQLTLDNYDETLFNAKRENIRGFTDQLLFLKDLLPKSFNSIDRLWNDKNFIQLNQELIQIIKIQLSSIALSFKSDHNLDLLIEKDLLEEINFFLSSIEKNTTEFSKLKNQVKSLINIENIHLETNEPLLNRINSLVKLIKELNFFNDKTTR